MTEKNIIREKYASMPDSELMTFTVEEGHYLTIEGIQLLKTEFIGRNLDTSIIEDIEKETCLSADLLKQDAVDSFGIAAWNYAFDEKENGLFDESILPGLIETGLSENHALSLLSMVKTKATGELKKAEIERMTGGLLFISGLAITFLPLYPNSNRLLYIFAWCMIFYGAGKFIKGLYYRSKFKKIIENIRVEDNC